MPSMYSSKFFYEQIYKYPMHSPLAELQFKKFQIVFISIWADSNFISSVEIVLDLPNVFYIYNCAAEISQNKFILNWQE